MCDFIFGIKKASIRSRNASYAGFAFAIPHKLCSNNVFKLSPYVVTAFAVFLLSFFAGIWDKPISGVGCRSPPDNLNFSKKIQIGGNRSV
ncbi:hypothetical protein [Acutalibacter muris]|uniref:hypothetical protein n=1 Tax=Acutalibacter muris TaxID=1796620 RepID=UPI001C3ECB4C|nr:hypothetical protein [Acutalibacter muris]